MLIEYFKGARMTQKRKNIVSAAQWFADNILDLSDSKAEIRISFIKDMLKNTGTFANCAWHKKDKLAVISIDADINKYLAISTIAHEMVHAKQWIKGELSHSRKGVLQWNKVIPAKKTAYHETDWEIEAMRKEVLMAHCFAHYTRGE